MNIPGFTADFSLYRTNHHYHVGRDLNSAGLIGQSVKPAMMAEEIEVFGCSPGFLQLGEGPNMTCIDPRNPFGGGGGGGGPTPTGPGSGGGGGGGGGGAQPPQRTCRPARGRVEVQGVLWRQQCPADKIFTCCKSKEVQCRADCGSSGTKAAAQCKSECSQSLTVCRDERNPRGPTVCSLP